MREQFPELEQKVARLVELYESAKAVTRARQADLEVWDARRRELERYRDALQKKFDDYKPMDCQEVHAELEIRGELIGVETALEIMRKTHGR